MQGGDGNAGDDDDWEADWAMARVPNEGELVGRYVVERLRAGGRGQACAPPR